MSFDPLPLADDGEENIEDFTGSSEVELFVGTILRRGTVPDVSVVDAPTGGFFDGVPPDAPIAANIGPILAIDGRWEGGVLDLDCW